MNKDMRKPMTIEDAVKNGGHPIPVDKFKLAAKKGGFVPYDGSGYYADDTHMDEAHGVWTVDTPPWATQVVFFAK